MVYRNNPHTSLFYIVRDVFAITGTGTEVVGKAREV